MVGMQIVGQGLGGRCLIPILILKADGKRLQFFRTILLQQGSKQGAIKASTQENANGNISNHAIFKGGVEYLFQFCPCLVIANIQQRLLIQTKHIPILSH